MMLFTPAPPTEYLGVVAYHDIEGTNGLTLARILAHTDREAGQALERELYATFGTTPETMEEIYEHGTNCGVGTCPIPVHQVEPPVQIDELHVYPEGSLRELDVIGTPLALAIARVEGGTE